MNERGTGWLGPEKDADPRDKEHLLRTAEPLLQAPLELKTKRWAMFRKPLNQHGTGIAVGCAWKHWMLTAPVIQTTPTAEPTAETIYREACALDPFTNNDPVDWNRGTTLTAGALALRGRGIIETFQHVFTSQEILNYLGAVDEAGDFIGGCLVLGIPILSSMWTCDPETGLWELSGEIEAWHAVLANQINIKKETLGGPCSWGFEFGKRKRDREDFNGYWSLRWEDLDKLLDMGGHGITSIEKRLFRN